MEAILHKAGPYDVTYIKCPARGGPVRLSKPRMAVLHTVEGGFDSGLAVFKKHFAPHFLISSSVIAQLVPIGTAGSALKAHNVDAMVQIEMATFSKEELWLPDDPLAKRVAAVMATCCTLFNIPLTHPWKDGGDWGKYGPNSHRSSGKWGKVPGWYGHVDVPDNLHWDPGNLQWSRLLSLAKTFVDPPAAVKRRHRARPAA